MDLWQWHCRNRREKKLLQLVCGNAIAEIGGKKFVAMPLSKMGGKKIVVAKIQRGIIKKKKCYIHNIFTTFSQQITGNQLLLVQISEQCCRKFNKKYEKEEEKERERKF